MVVINMQTMRYINLLDRVSRVKTNKCFGYNNMIIFAVPQAVIRRAIGNNGENIRQIQLALGKRIKIIREPQDMQDAERFVRDIVEPVQFKSLEFNGESFILTAGMQSKAALIGRNKKRLEELTQIFEDSFGKPLRIV